MTLGLKRNIAIPFGYFYIANKLRSDIFKNINLKSWFNYGFLIKSSLFSNNIQKNLFLSFEHRNFNLNSFSMFSDISYNIRRDFSLIHPLGSDPFDLDLSVSNFNHIFYHYDLKQRSQSFWIANQNCFRSADLLISSFEQPVFKDSSLIDWSFWVSYVSVNYHKYLKNKLNFNFKNSMIDFVNLDKYLNLSNILKSWILNFYDINFVNFIVSFFYSVIFKRINNILLFLFYRKSYIKKNNNIFKYFSFSSTSFFIKLKSIAYYLLSSYFNLDNKYFSLNFNFIDSTFNFLKYKFSNIKNLNVDVFFNLKVKFLFNYLYKNNKLNNKCYLKWNSYYFSYKKLLNRRSYLNKFLFFNSIIL